MIKPFLSNRSSQQLGLTYLQWEGDSLLSSALGESLRDDKLIEVLGSLGSLVGVLQSGEGIGSVLLHGVFLERRHDVMIFGVTKVLLLNYFLRCRFPTTNGGSGCVCCCVFYLLNSRFVVCLEGQQCFTTRKRLCVGL